MTYIININFLGWVEEVQRLCLKVIRQYNASKSLSVYIRANTICLCIIKMGSVPILNINDPSNVLLEITL